MTLITAWRKVGRQVLWNLIIAATNLSKESQTCHCYHEAKYSDYIVHISANIPNCVNRWIITFLYGIITLCYLAVTVPRAF